MATASVSTENLTMSSRLQRAPSLTQAYSRSRSGIPVAATPTASRDPPPPMHRGCPYLFVVIKPNILFLCVCFFKYCYYN